MRGNVTVPSKLSAAFRVSIILILLVSFCVQGWGQVVHENPGTAIPSRSQPIDDQMAALLESMLQNLGDVSAAVNSDNFTSARTSYARFYSSFSKYNDLVWQLNLSEADYRTLADQMNITNDQVRTIIDEAEVYRESMQDFDRAVAGNDQVNASASAAQMRESYANLSSSYGGLRYNATVLGRVLADRGVDTVGLDSSIGSLDQLMAHYNQSYSNVSSGGAEGPRLTISAGGSNLSVGDEVEFRVVLKDVNGTPMGGNKIMVYVGGDLAGVVMHGDAGVGAERVVQGGRIRDHQSSSVVLVWVSAASAAGVISRQVRCARPVIVSSSYTITSAP